jgi:subtilisin family serine protease
MRILLLLALCLAPLAVLAEGTSRLDTAPLPSAILAKIKRDPAGYVAELGVLIEGFGKDGAIDLTGLGNVVALARAEARALAFRRLQGADLDGDGSIDGAELAVAAAAASAVARGRLKVNFATADGDGDGRVTAGEVQTFANDVALQAFRAEKAAAVLAVLWFDGDGDGRVTRAEAEAGVAALALTLAEGRASASGQAKEIQNQFQVQSHDHQGDQHRQGDQPEWRLQRPHLGAI